MRVIQKIHTAKTKCMESNGFILIHQFYIQFDIGIVPLVGKLLCIIRQFNYTCNCYNYYITAIKYLCTMTTY